MTRNHDCVTAYIIPHVSGERYWNETNCCLSSKNPPDKNPGVSESTPPWWQDSFVARRSVDINIPSLIPVSLLMCSIMSSFFHMDYWTSLYLVSDSHYSQQYIRYASESWSQKASLIVWRAIPNTCNSLWLRITLQSSIPIIYYQ